ncbi:uncharacterized protein TRUGW13939_04438 [Talaromyces rugulosus]|uniref:DUF1446-domain-containing protein n=1 Tax=Talaromyces rugulosus TaxID=121627 RepID=A0A7H8QU53_TALRU|nr:uncharacterized protein TRUGW13939_04438 [Talaromyces rugulosus]QKX57326.1 hypothetical protein TRUGW13939_04438 [Talaromyces rugulosus]
MSEKANTNGNGHSRPIVIGNVAGAMEEAPDAMYRMVTGKKHIDAITGDWAAELNIAWNAIRKYQDPSKGYEPGFLDQLDDSIDTIVSRGIKIVSNAGVLNVVECAKRTIEICQKHGYDKLVVAYVEGDNISDIVTDPKMLDAIGGIRHLDHPDCKLEEWKTPYCGVAYFGCRGIVEALRQGADIVICGRVTDASPVLALAAWWHNWDIDNWDAFANALVAGHLIECGPYATGANFSGFKAYLDDFYDLGFPIAEIDVDGSSVITKHEEARGYVDQMNLRAQFLYEIQGHVYLNPDVSADIENVRIENVPNSTNRVRISGAKGNPPPPTTKAIVCAIGGYQAEAVFYINGLDIDAKEQLLRRQLTYAFRNSNFSDLSIVRYGSVPPNPQSQASGTVTVRVLAKATTLEDISFKKFREPIYALRMQLYPGYHMGLDFRTMDPRMFMEIFPGLIEVKNLPHRVVVGDRIIDIEPHKVTAPAPGQRPSYETANPRPLESFGPTKKAPLGAVAHARSGDKGDNVNVGLFARSLEEYTWLQSFLTEDRIKGLFADDWKDLSRIERCEFPHILAVHFRVLDFLGGGGASSTRIDSLGKGVAEYLRSRIVDIPEKFLKNPKV